MTLSIVGKTLFDSDVESKADEVGVAVTEVLETFWFTLLPFQGLIERLPLPVLRRGRASRARLDALIYAMIDERRATGRDHGDLLSMLLAVRDDQSQGLSPEDNRRQGLSLLSPQQVRDEAITLLLAGHETTANALTWTWYLLSQHPEVEARLHAEIDAVLDGRLPTLADIAAPAARRAGRDRIDAAVSAGLDHRPARNRRVHARPLHGAAARDDFHEPVRDAARCAVLSRSRALRPSPLDARMQRPPCRSSPISPSVAARANASASTSPGWSSCCWWPPSLSSGSSDWCRITRLSRSR